MGQFVNVTLPVFNEENKLAATVEKVSAYLRLHPEQRYELVIASNGSTDRTVEIARSLQQIQPNLQVVDLPKKGRGSALKHVWNRSAADIFSYMDCDLSTDLNCLQPLLAPLLARTHDIAIGSRLRSESSIQRGFKRSFISKSYNVLVKTLFDVSFSDAQCGFKAISRKAFGQIGPFVEDDGWFFDTELLIVAENLGHRVFELPVQWVENSDSKVKIISTVIADFKGLLRVKTNLMRGREVRLSDEIY